MFSEENARRDGLLQRRDPRVKLIAFVAMVTAAGLSRQWIVLAGLYAATLFAVWASKIDVWPFLKRVWLGIPLFSGIVVLPSIFFHRGAPLFEIPLWFVTLAVSRGGLAGAGIFVLRVAVSVSLAVLLILSTRWVDILKSLRSLRVPDIFVLILAMTYRYIFLVLHTVNGMLLARKSRVVARTSGKEQRRWVVLSIGVLMSRSFRLSDEVYQAMLARGFDHSIRTFADYHLNRVDWALAFTAFAIAGVTVCMNGLLS